MAVQPDPQAQDTLKQSHAVAQSALAMGHQAVGAAHKQVMAAVPKHMEIMQALSQLGQGQDQGGGGDPESAVWQAFPGTDPKVVQQLSAQGPDPAPLFKLFAADEAKLMAMHQANLEAHVNAHSEPQGGGQPLSPPGVTGGF